MFRFHRCSIAVAAATVIRTASMCSALMHSLPPRLGNVLSIANSITTSSPRPLALLDVCGDHALLPIHASATPNSPFSSFISSDISENACRSALETIGSIPSSVPVDVVNCDGLKPYVDAPSPNRTLYVTVIAGVGVRTILSILEPLATSPQVSNFPHLILSPTNTRSTNLNKLFCSEALRRYNLVLCKVNKERERFYFALHFSQITAVSGASPRPTTTALSSYVDPLDSESLSCLADWTERQRLWDLSDEKYK